MSSLGLKGSLTCPQDPVYSSYPPPNPPAPKACTAGPDPRRGCPHLQWYWNNQTAVRPMHFCTSLFHAVSWEQELLL